MWYGFMVKMALVIMAMGKMATVNWAAGKTVLYLFYF